MQDATAAQTQSAPQVSQTPQTSYVAPQTAQAPSVATSPQWVAPTQPQQAPAPVAQAQMGVQGIQYNPTQYNPQPQQAAPQAENPYKDAFTKVVGLLSSPVNSRSRVNSRLRAKQPTKPITDTNKQPHTAIRVSRLICLRATATRHTPTALPKLLRR